MISSRRFAVPRKLGFKIGHLPGGHLTTNEQPEALEALVAKFERGLAKIPEPQSTVSAGAP